MLNPNYCVPITELVRRICENMSEYKIEKLLESHKHRNRCSWLSKHAKTYRARKRNYKRFMEWED
jgi:hypothetical protein